MIKTYIEAQLSFKAASRFCKMGNLPLALQAIRTYRILMQQLGLEA